MGKRRYITTAIDYPNAAPHMGHVLEKVLADVCARWFRLCGNETRFQIGTDEHGVKVQRTAEKEGISPKELVDRNVPLFQELYKKLGISYDAFVRTSDQKNHWPTVTELWKKLDGEGKLEKRSYTGLYCSGCERFMTKKDLEDGMCVNHKKAPEEVTEENWFFKLGEDAPWLKKLLKAEIKDGGYKIEPDFRAQETLSLIDQGLEDVSFSRPTSSLRWGIPVPGDPDHVMYVWCDALTNYISGLDYFGLSGISEVARHERAGDVSRLGVEWWDDAEVTHVIGKDIARFHALIWPAMLKAAGVRTPDRLLIHGFLTSEGEKMSKSLGNVVAPDDVLEKFGGNPDPLRFYLSHEVPVGRDGNFSWDRIEKLYDSMLRNKLGNLLNRVIVLIHKEETTLDIATGDPLSQKITSHWQEFADQMNAFELHSAITAHPVALVEAGNLRMDEKKPWTLSGSERVQVLSGIAEMLRHIPLMLLPFIPETAQRISKQLNVPYADEMLEKSFKISPEMKRWGGRKDWKNVGVPEILFKPLDS